MTFPSRFQNSSIVKTFWLPKPQALWGLLLLLLALPLEDAVRTGPATHINAQQEITANATRPQVQDTRERCSSSLGQPQSSEEQQRDSRETESCHLFPGAEEGQDFFPIVIKANIFRMAIMKQTPISVYSMSGTVRASK